MELFIVICFSIIIGLLFRIYNIIAEWIFQYKQANDFNAELMDVLFQYVKKEGTIMEVGNNVFNNAEQE